MFQSGIYFVNLYIKFVHNNFIDVYKVYCLLSSFISLINTVYLPHLNLFLTFISILFYENNLYDNGFGVTL